ncbi:hypothetical protein [Dyadobacter sp. 22481]|uniref:hypothetical protein n=1 Tax=Dyadobacter sp. 22481 TaxID=3453926 RepID=UPI003F85A5AA
MVMLDMKNGAGCQAFGNPDWPANEAYNYIDIREVSKVTLEIAFTNSYGTSK